MIHNFVRHSHVQTIQSGPENNAQSIMHHHSATACSRITRFPPKCSGTGKIIVCQSMQNVYQLVKSLLNSHNYFDTHYERRHPACEHMTALTV